MLESLVVSPDSRHVAYAVKREEKWLVVVDGVEGKKYDGILEGMPVFSPNSKRVAYVAQRGGKWLVVIDGGEGKKYDRSDGLRSAPTPSASLMSLNAERKNL